MDENVHKTQSDEGVLCSSAQTHQPTVVAIQVVLLDQAVHQLALVLLLPAGQRIAISSCDPSKSPAAGVSFPMVSCEWGSVHSSTCLGGNELVGSTCDGSEDAQRSQRPMPMYIHMCLMQYLSPELSGLMTPPTKTRLASLRSRWLLANNSTRPVRFLTRSSRAMVKMTGLFLSCSLRDTVAVHIDDTDT